MNIFWKLTGRTMKANRVRTTASIVGVILSSAMFVAVTTMCVSTLSYLKESYIWSYGNYHVSRSGLTQEEYEEMTRDRRVSEFASSRTLGFAEIENENDDKPYLEIDAVDNAFLESMPVHLTRGRLPENSRELLLPDHLTTRGGVTVEIGQTMDLQVGQRISGGQVLYGENPYEEGELLKDTEAYRFTVVGTYEWPSFEEFDSAGYISLTMEDSDLPAGDSRNAWILLKNPRKDLGSFLADYEEFGVISSTNNSLLAIEGASQYTNYNMILYGMGGILILLIMLGSVSMIYSAFSISVSDRTRQFGLLSSAGASRKQLRKCVRQEALLVSAAGIPAGIVCGLAGIWITLQAVQEQFRSLTASQLSIQMKVEPLAIGIAAAVAFLTVWISAWVPSKRAMRVTAIEAIRQNQDIRTQGRPVHISGVMLRLFGLEGLLAKKYFRRSKKKYRATIISMALSVMIFIASAAYGTALSSVFEREIYVHEADLVYSYGSEAKMEQLNAWLRQEPQVEKTAWSRWDNFFIGKDENYVEEQYYLDNGMEVLDDGDGCWVAGVCYMDEETYREVVRENRLDESVFLDTDNPPAILVNYGRTLNYGEGNSRSMVEYKYVREGTDHLTVVERKNLPDGIPEAEQDEWISYMLWEGTTGRWMMNYENINSGEQRQEPAATHEIAVGALIDDLPLGADSGALIYPMSACPESLKEETTGNISITVKDYQEALRSLDQYLEEHNMGKGDGYISDLYKQEQDSRNIVAMLEVFSIGFTVLMTLITAVNVFHTISTSLTLRRRDFAMLRSVGMTPREMNRMLNYECLIYGVKCLIYGVPLGVLMACLIQMVLMQADLQTVTIAWQIYPAAVFLVWILVWLSTCYARARLRRHSLIEDLKNDNI